MAVTREQIADSFRRRVESKGFRKTSVEEIAKDLHISKKTIYVHFESKDDIYRFVLERLAAEERTRIADLLAGRETYREKIQGLVGVIFEFARDWWDCNRESEFVERYEIGESTFLDAYTELIREYVCAGADSGEFSVEDCEMTVHFIGGIILAGTRMLHEDPSIEPEPHATQAVDRLLVC